MKKIARYAFSLFFIVAGIAHFVLESFFLKGMPDWTPYPIAIIYLSGVMEILLAIGLLVKKTRRKAGILIAIFLVLIFPVNIYMALTPEKFDIAAYILWLRLPFQFLFIWWVLKVSK